jgi:signal transduction histidine kinase
MNPIVAMRRLLIRWRSRLGVRMRSALAAAAVVAVASALTGVGLGIGARLIMTDTVEQAINDRAGQIAADVANGDAPERVEALPSGRESTLVQVIDPTGRVLAASAPLAGVGAISPLRPLRGRTGREHRRLSTDGHDDVYAIVAIGVDSPAGRRIVLVARSLDEVDDGTAAAAAALLLGLPVLTLVVGVATFLFVGRSLRPVEAMRRQADTITGRNLDLRLPVPHGDDEVTALASTMNTMLDRIETATAAQRRFVADASHELRSPLATIHAGLDLLTGAKLGEEIQAQVQRMHRESDRMRRLIDDLLLLARVDEAAVRLRHDDVDLDDIVYAERDRITAQRPDLLITARVIPVRVSGDPHYLHRAVRNLVDNAARHAATTVTVGLSGNADTAEITVIDDGPGIPAEERHRVFDRFVRLDEDRSRRAGGTGLGLPIARDIVTRHGGTIRLDDVPGGGTVARITLPAQPPSALIR